MSDDAARQGQSGDDLPRLKGPLLVERSEALRARLGLSTTSRVERIDPHSLQPLQQSPRLPGGLAVVTIDHPPLNLFDGSMGTGLVTAVV